MKKLAGARKVGGGGRHGVQKGLGKHFQNRDFVFHAAVHDVVCFVLVRENPEALSARLQPKQNQKGKHDTGLASPSRTRSHMLIVFSAEWPRNRKSRVMRRSSRQLVVFTALHSSMLSCVSGEM